MLGEACKLSSLNNVSKAVDTASSIWKSHTTNGFRYFQGYECALDDNGVVQATFTAAELHKADRSIGLNLCAPPMHVQRESLTRYEDASGDRS